MAAFPVRVRGPQGQTTLSIEPKWSVHELLAEFSKATGVQKEGIAIRAGFPPKALSIPEDQSRAVADAFNIARGDTLIVSSDLAQPQQSQASSSSQQSAAPSSASAPSFSLGGVQSATPRAAPPPASASSASMNTDKVKNTSVPAPSFGGSLVIRVAPDDNSCLFHALGLLLLPGDSTAVATLRKEVAQTIQSDPDQYSDAILGMPRDQYISTIQKSSSWGGAIELAILSTVHQVEIAAIDIQSSRIDRYGQGQYDNLALLLYSGIHYDSATASPLPPDSFDMLDFDTRLFPAHDGDGVLTCLSSLASALKEKRYYTDTANFTLKCEVCRKGLVGQKDAQAHAMETGHASFGEY